MDPDLAGDTDSWLYLAQAEFSSLRIYKRMSIDELPQATLQKIYRYLTTTDFCKLVFCSKAFAYSVRESLRTEEVIILKNDSIRMSHQRTVSLLQLAKHQHYLALCCLNVKINNIMPYLSPSLQVLKLHWVQEALIQKDSFWRDLLNQKNSLTKISLKVIRRGYSSPSPMITLTSLNQNQMKTFFSQMAHLQSFSYQVKYLDTDKQIPQFSKAIENSTTILIGLLSSSTNIKKLKFTNMIILSTTVDNPIQNKTVQQIKVFYQDISFLPGLPSNSVLLRLTSPTLKLILRHFKAVSKITINDWNSEDNKGFSSSCISQLLDHQMQLNKTMTLDISSFQWHWQVQKINLFQLCDLKLQGQLALRSLFTLDTDATNLISTQNKSWNVSGMEFSYTNINDESLEVISTLYSHINVLGISGCKRITREGMLEYLPCFTNLQELSAQQIHTFTNKVLEIIVKFNKDTLEKLKFKKNKLSGQAVENCLRQCKRLKSLTLRNMNATYDDFQFRWIDSLRSDKFVCRSLLQLDISNNLRFHTHLIKKLRKIFPNLLTLKISHTYQISQKQKNIHPNVENLSAQFQFSKLSRYKKNCLGAFPSLVILHTDLEPNVAHLLSNTFLEYYERRILVYALEGKTFVI